MLPLSCYLTQRTRRLRFSRDIAFGMMPDCRFAVSLRHVIYAHIAAYRFTLMFSHAFAATARCRFRYAFAISRLRRFHALLDCCVLIFAAYLFFASASA